MKTKSVLLVVAVLFPLTQCSPVAEPEDEGGERRRITVLTSTDPKTLTLQASDLEEGFAEAGRLIEANSETLKQLYDSGAIGTQLFEDLNKGGFAGYASRTFTRGEEQVVSTVVIFEDESSARTFFDSYQPVNEIDDAPVLGDDSVFDHVEAGPSPQTGDEQVVDSEAILARIRVGNAVIEVHHSSDAQDLDPDDSAAYAERALARIE